ncbi:MULTISPECIES: GNAT family N-acetyltransferase [unclassified Pseudarthrobacter]|uniref:GNAT family N-acetyltransferase n=1 Tax=unclassified Pseudarthrobacter TaxID=2647000 RepID=UPI00363BFAAE
MATVRPAEEGDLPGILDTDRQSGRNPSTLASLAAALSDPNRLVVVAESGGEVVGWGKTHYWDYPDGPAPAGHYLGGVTVRPPQRRHGVGAALTAARLHWIWDRTPDAWYVVNAGNTASIGLHSAWGFVEVARAARFHTTTFDGGTGLLLRAHRPGRGLAREPDSRRRAL